jgi:hypothetical protein
MSQPSKVTTDIHTLEQTPSQESPWVKVKNSEFGEFEWRTAF